MSTRVVNILRTPEYDVYIGRPGPWGNPYHITSSCKRERAIEFYREWFERELERDPVLRARVASLSGRTLGCYCAPLACHGNVLAELADRLAEEA